MLHRNRIVVRILPMACSCRGSLHVSAPTCQSVLRECPTAWVCDCFVAGAWWNVYEANTPGVRKIIDNKGEQCTE